MKQYSSIRSVQILAQSCKELGILDFVISPGSRNAPLAIHFAETDAFNCYSIVDERSAAFVAMGMAKSLKKPVAVICTSGSATANYYPAVTEAFYQNIPLLVLSADRPPDYVDLFDGQTIRQNLLFQQHSYGDFQLKEDQEEDADAYNLEVSKAAIERCLEKCGPVHINIPLQEPLYNLVSELPFLPKIEKSLSHKKYQLDATLVAEWHLAKRILILVGMHDPSEEFQMQMSQLVKNHSAVILTEVTSNLKNEKYFQHIDRYIYNFTEQDMRHYAPDLLITIGQNVVSKKVKQFLRTAKIENHWHVNPFWQPDTYFSLTRKIETPAEIFFSKLLKEIKLEPKAYYNLWDVLRDKKDAKHEAFVNHLKYCDFQFFKLLSDEVPSHYNVHFSNSAPIRYAQLFNFDQNKTFCNRGTSGIDGCTSTAMGFAMADKNPTLLVTGDVSFFYDINGLWNQYIPPYTRIIIINNGGGDIFKIIPGPSKAANALDEFIATKHHKNAEYLAAHFGFLYTRVEDEATLVRVLPNFFKPGVKAKILEVNTQDVENSKVLIDYFEFLK